MSFYVQYLTVFTWVFGCLSFPRTSFNLLYWSSAASCTNFHLEYIVQYNTVQYSTVQYSKVQYSTVQ